MLKMKKELPNLQALSASEPMLVYLIEIKYINVLYPKEKECTEKKLFIIIMNKNLKICFIIKFIKKVR